MFFYVEPEVAGGLGPRSIVHRAEGKLIVTRLNYEFDGWLGDPLLETTPCFIVSDKLRQAIEARALTGASFADVEVTRSATFSQLYPALQLPMFWWLVVNGTPFEDDFGLAADLRLVASKRALVELQNEGMKHAIVCDAE